MTYIPTNITPITTKIGNDIASFASKTTASNLDVSNLTDGLLDQIFTNISGNPRFKMKHDVYEFDRKDNLYGIDLTKVPYSDAWQALTGHLLDATILRDDVNPAALTKLVFASIDGAEAYSAMAATKSSKLFAEVMMMFTRHMSSMATIETSLKEFTLGMQQVTKDDEMEELFNKLVNNFFGASFSGSSVPPAVKGLTFLFSTNHEISHIIKRDEYFTDEQYSRPALLQAYLLATACVCYLLHDTEIDVKTDISARVDSFPPFSQSDNGVMDRVIALASVLAHDMMSWMVGKAVGRGSEFITLKDSCKNAATVSGMANGSEFVNAILEYAGSVSDNPLASECFLMWMRASSQFRLGESAYDPAYINVTTASTIKTLAQAVSTRQEGSSAPSTLEREIGKAIVAKIVPSMDLLMTHMDSCRHVIQAIEDIPEIRSGSISKSDTLRLIKDFLNFTNELSQANPDLAMEKVNLFRTRQMKDTLASRFLALNAPDLHIAASKEVTASDLGTLINHYVSDIISAVPTTEAPLNNLHTAWRGLGSVDLDIQHTNPRKYKIPLNGGVEADNVDLFLNPSLVDVEKFSTDFARLKIFSALCNSSLLRSVESGAHAGELGDSYVNIPTDVMNKVGPALRQIESAIFEQVKLLFTTKIVPESIINGVALASVNEVFHAAENRKITLPHDYAMKKTHLDEYMQAVGITPPSPGGCLLIDMPHLTDLLPGRKSASLLTNKFKDIATGNVTINSSLSCAEGIVNNLLAYYNERGSEHQTFYQVQDLFRVKFDKFNSCIDSSSANTSYKDVYSFNPVITADKVRIKAHSLASDLTLHHTHTPLAMSLYNPVFPVGSTMNHIDKDKVNEMLTIITNDVYCDMAFRKPLDLNSGEDRKNFTKLGGPSVQKLAFVTRDYNTIDPKYASDFQVKMVSCSNIPRLALASVLNDLGLSETSVIFFNVKFTPAMFFNLISHSDIFKIKDGLDHTQLMYNGYSLDNLIELKEELLTNSVAGRVCIQYWALSTAPYTDLSKSNLKIRRFHISDVICLNNQQHVVKIGTPLTTHVTKMCKFSRTRRDVLSGIYSDDRIDMFSGITSQDVGNLILHAFHELLGA